MKLKYIINLINSNGSTFGFIGILTLLAYTLNAYNVVSGLSLRDLVAIHNDNLLYYLSNVFFILWAISMFYLVDTESICNKYKVAVIK